MKPFANLPIVALACVILLSIATTGCDHSNTPSADRRQAQETAKRLQQADREIGMPDITRFTERKLAKQILELRDKEIVTYCYIATMHGKLIFIGEAIGFGLPYSVQYTNPEKQVSYGYGDSRGRLTIPQADPNGLFMPEGLSATWIMLKGPDGKARPVYMEPEIVVSPFPLHKVAVK